MKKLFKITIACLLASVITNYEATAAESTISYKTVQKDQIFQPLIAVFDATHERLCVATSFT